MMKVLLFAAVAERAGCRGLELEVPAGGLTAAEVKALLAARFPQAELELASAYLAVNEQFVTPDTLVQDGDTVAVIPPVSGG